MVNLITTYDILNILKKGCYHKPRYKGDICRACLDDIERWAKEKAIGDRMTKNGEEYIYLKGIKSE